MSSAPTPKTTLDMSPDRATISGRDKKAALRAAHGRFLSFKEVG